MSIKAPCVPVRLPCTWLDVLSALICPSNRNDQPTKPPEISLAVSSRVRRKKYQEKQQTEASVHSPASPDEKNVYEKTDTKQEGKNDVVSGGGGGVRALEEVIRPQRCTGVSVCKATPLCWAGRTPPTGSGQWTWSSRRQGWRRSVRPLHTLVIWDEGQDQMKGETRWCNRQDEGRDQMNGSQEWRRTWSWRGTERERTHFDSYKLFMLKITLQAHWDGFFPYEFFYLQIGYYVD